MGSHVHQYKYNFLWRFSFWTHKSCYDHNVNKNKWLLRKTVERYNFQFEILMSYSYVTVEMNSEG